MCAVYLHAETQLLRLVGSSKSGEGLLQVLYRGTWGYISAEGEGAGDWDWPDARVACRSLGRVTGLPVDDQRFTRSNTSTQRPVYSVSWECEWWEAGLQDCSRKYDYIVEAYNPDSSYRLAAVGCRNGGCMHRGLDWCDYTWGYIRNVAR